MGFRDFDPGLNRFLTRDMFNGALADLSLGSNPWTLGRYTFAGGNPTTLVEYDGHAAVRDIVAGGASPSTATTVPSEAGDEGGFCSGLWNCATEIGEQWAGIHAGTGQHLIEAGNALWDMSAAWADCMQERWLPMACDPGAALIVAAIDDPSQVGSDIWHGMVDPIVDDWTQGNYGEAGGRGAATLGEIAFGSRGAGALLRAVRGGATRAAPATPELVDLTTPTRRGHIFHGDGTGGGHLWPGLPGKTSFPRSWSADRILHEISDIATDPAATRVVQGRRTVVTGTRGGVVIRVIVDNGTGDIVTGYPTNLPRNP